MARANKERLKKKFPRIQLRFLDPSFWEGYREKCEKWMMPATWGALVVTFYLISSLLTPWTGAIGSAIAQSLLDSMGGSVLILLLFCLYVCFSIILNREIPNPSSQALGTACLFLTACFFLGLAEMLQMTPAGISWLAPGRIGSALATWSYENLGPLGTTLLSGSFFITTVILLGCTLPDRYNLLSYFPMRWFKRGKGHRHEAGLPIPSEELEALPELSEADELDEIEDALLSPLPDKEPTEEDMTSLDIWGNLEVQQDLREVTELSPAPRWEESAEEHPFEVAESIGTPAIFPPPLGIFGAEETDEHAMDEAKARPWGDRIISSLREFGIEAELAETLVGPTVIQFRIQLAPGIKVSRVAALANDLALALAVASLRVETPIPGKPYIGIEIPNPKRQGITLRSVLEASESGAREAELPLPMGVTVDGDPLIMGLEGMPHLLVAGTTGSGKSVFVNSCIVGLCSRRRPCELRMVLVDPKRVEMAIYEKLPHILTPPVTDPKKAVHILAWALREMQDRYERFAQARVRNLTSYNEKVLPKDRLPYIVIVVDELADLMMTSPKEVEEYICRLAQMARATGIHLILATQRPSVNVITGLIKANIPARVAFTLPGSADSRTIIDCGGAEKLLGKGDMLFLSTQNPKPIRVQAAWVDEKAIALWLDYLIRLFGEPEYIDIDDQGGIAGGGAGSSEGDFSDPLLEEAVGLVLSTGMASASGLQRRLRVGFTRASRLIDMMESLGIVGPSDGAKPRDILVDEEEAAQLLDRTLS